MIDYKYSNLFFESSTDKQFKIEYDGGIITNNILHSQEFELAESLCSESELRFGSCESSVVKFRVSNIIGSLKGKWLTVSIVLNNNTDMPFLLGKYKVESDVPTADRSYRDITAYDIMHDIIKEDVSEWYNSLPYPTTLKNFRNSFFRHFNLDQEEAFLINDDMKVEKTIQPEQISGLDVISSICELNGCFGHISRSGRFQYIHLKEIISGLYPRNDLYPANDLFPHNPNTVRVQNSHYISCQYEDYKCERISKLQIRQEENDVGKIIGTGDNCYIIEDNFLVYGKTDAELNKIAKNLFSIISVVSYRPSKCLAIGSPCFEIGDAIRLRTSKQLIETYILQRTMKGVQSLRDNYESDGVEKYSEDVNSTNKSIIQLKGKTNVLIRTVEETKSTITDVEKGLQTQITQTAEELRLEASDTKRGLQSEISQTAAQIRLEVKNTTDGLSSSITQTAESIKSEVERATNAETLIDGKVQTTKTELSSQIEQTAENITSSVRANYETKTDASSSYTNLSSKIDQSATSIISTVESNYETKTDASSSYTNLSSKITQTAENVNTKVSKNDVISEINQSAEEVKIAANRLTLEGNAKITGGTIHIYSEEAVGNIIEFKRPGTRVQMGNDGMRAEADTRTALFQYSEISVTNASSSGNLVAKLTDQGQGISSYGWESYSDKRLKNSITPLSQDESLNFILSLNPCKYIYNYDEKKMWRHGFIANEVQEKVCGKKWALCNSNIGTDGNSYLTLNYSELISDLVSSVQELNKKILFLENKLNEKNL